MTEEIHDYEPENPDKYYFVTEWVTIDGVHGKAKTKVWRDPQGKQHRKQVGFDPIR